MRGFGQFAEMFRCVIALAVMAGPVFAADEAQPAVAERPATVAAVTTGTDSSSALAPEVSLRPRARDERLPSSRWRHLRHGALWTRAAMSALGDHAAPLAMTVPRDIADWCPGYARAGIDDRRAFWVGFLSALARHESRWRQDAVGGGGKWHGLLQILPATARGYGCIADTGPALQYGPANLSCALRIMTRTVRRDGVIARGMRGVAADWGPMRSASKRREMAAWLSSQSYCRPVAGIRPVARPGAGPHAHRPSGAGFEKQEKPVLPEPAPKFGLAVGGDTAELNDIPGKSDVERVEFGHGWRLLSGQFLSGR